MLIDEIIDDILEAEGGYSNHPSDRGGPTKKGITIGTLSQYLKKDVTADDVKNLTDSEIREIYKEKYYQEPGFSFIVDSDLLGLVIDSSVQHGPVTVIRWLQRIVDVNQDGIIGKITESAIESHGAAWLYRKLICIRVGYYFSIIADHPNQSVFARGWFNRIKPFIENAP